MKRDPNYIDPRDLKFVPIEPDPDFDPEHNRRVIEKTLKHAERMHERKKKEYIENGAGERLQAAAQFIKAGQQGGKSTNIETYFGKKHLAYLRGMQVIDYLKQNQDKITMLKHAKKKQEIPKA